MLKEKIQQLLAGQNKKVKDLCSYIEITDTGLRKIYARDSCELTTLKRIAEFFNVSPSYFIEAPSSAYATDGSVAVCGNAQEVNSFKTIQAMLEEMAAQRRLTEKALDKIAQMVDFITGSDKVN